MIILLAVGAYSTEIRIPNPTDTEEPDYSIVVYIVEKLYLYPLIYHCDNRTVNSDLLIRVNNENHTYYIRNYDLPNMNSYSKRSDNRYIHIIDLSYPYGSETDYFGFKNIYSKDIVIFLIRQKSVPEVFSSKWAGIGLIVISLIDSKLFTCSHQNSQFICNWEPIKSGELNRKWISKDLIDLTGLTFRVGYSVNAPYVYKTEKSGLAGSEVKLLKLLSKLLHFRYKLISFTNYKGNKYSAMLKHLENGSIWWSIGGINQNLYRTRIYDVMRYTTIGGMTAMFYKHKETHQLSIFSFQGFQIMSFLVLLGITLLFLIEHISSSFFKNARKDKIRILMVIAAPLMDQIHPAGNMFRQKPVKFVLLLWWFSCYIFSLTYKNYLLASIIYSPETTSSVSDLLEDGYRFESSEDDYYYIQQSCGDTVECIGVKKRISANDMCNSSSMLKWEKLALVGEKHALGFKALRKCQKLSLTDKTEVTFANDEILGLELQSWIMQKHSILTGIFSRIVSRIEAAGFFTKCYLRP
ncbi:uncharacterized protein isoform X2 [Leptinotarsa decemlineata]|uniref:uncharacterized protein isoform X2 n=1 Tax=Leptinotarsa decemlineata TaxID=7539 RepID=UPI003D308E33